MRIIEGSSIIDLVKEMCIEANTCLPDDVKTALSQVVESETFKGARDILEIIQRNAEIAENKNVAMCQDTGMLVAFVEIGQDVHIKGGHIEELINEGVRQGYRDGFLRKSIVSDPIRRENTKDNTPAVIHYKILPGEVFNITVAPKGLAVKI